MDLLDVIRSMWRHRIITVLTLAVVMGATGAFVALQKPQYQSTVTLQLSSTDPAFLNQVNAIVPVYAELLDAQQTRSLAQTTLGATSLADITVRTFSGSPVIKVDARSDSTDSSTASAAAMVGALQVRVGSGSNLGIPGVGVVVIDGPSVADKVWPKPAISLGVAAAAGLLLAAMVAMLAERRPRRRTELPAAAPAPRPVDHDPDDGGRAPGDGPAAVQRRRGGATVAPHPRDDDEEEVDERAAENDERPPARVATRSGAAPVVAARSGAAPVVATRSGAVPGQAARSAAAPVVATRSGAVPVQAARSAAAPTVAARSAVTPLVAEKSALPSDEAGIVAIDGLFERLGGGVRKSGRRR